MSGIRTCVVVAVVGWFGVAADFSEAALAKKAGGSGLSGTLSSNKAIRKQQLICDPDEPTGGSTSVRYDPAVVSISGFGFGPGYAGTAFVEVSAAGGQRTTLVELDDYLSEPFGTQTGYVQVRFGEPPATTAVVSPSALHGQIAPPDGYAVVDEDGPFGVDTHALFFDYLATASDDTVAEYTIFAAEADEFSNSQADFLSGIDDDDGNPFTLTPNQIASATVRGSLNAVPLPAAAIPGGLTLAAVAAVRVLRRRAV